MNRDLTVPQGGDPDAAGLVPEHGKEVRLRVSARRQVELVGLGTELCGPGHLVLPQGVKVEFHLQRGEVCQIASPSEEKTSPFSTSFSSLL